MKPTASSCSSSVVRADFWRVLHLCHEPILEPAPRFSAIVSSAGREARGLRPAAIRSRRKKKNLSLTTASAPRAGLAAG